MQHVLGFNHSFSKRISLFNVKGLLSFQWNLLHFNLCQLLLALSLDTTKSLALSSLLLLMLMNSSSGIYKIDSIPSEPSIFSKPNCYLFHPLLVCYMLYCPKHFHGFSLGSPCLVPGSSELDAVN